MSKLQELIDTLKSDEEIIRFKQLENIIDHNESIREDFMQLLHLQKIMVQKEYKKLPDYTEAKEKYDKHLEKMTKYPLIDEYLELLENINSDLSIIKSIIESEIGFDFD